MYIYETLRASTASVRTFSPYRSGISGKETDNSDAMRAVVQLVAGFKAEKIGKNQIDMVTISHEGRKAFKLNF